MLKLKRRVKATAPEAHARFNAFAETKIFLSRKAGGLSISKHILPPWDFMPNHGFAKARPGPKAQAGDLSLYCLER